MSSIAPIPRPGTLSRSEAVYALCCSAFAVVLVLTNIIGVKLFLLFPDHWPTWLNGGTPPTLTSGIITYPLTFLLTDIVSEIWGRKRANFMVILGFIMSLLMLAVVNLALALPSSPMWNNVDLGMTDPLEMQFAFEATFYYPHILLFASMGAYLVAQLFDVRLYHFWWRVTGGGHMWIRNNGSTMISQLADTIIVNSIFLRWGLALDWGTIGEIILAVYLCKVALAVLDTPLIYLARGLIERYLGIEHEPGRRSAPMV
jgi:uncharacterized integral membrane protein (TIGR00697 family)